VFAPRPLVKHPSRWRRCVSDSRSGSTISVGISALQGGIPRIAQGQMHCRNPGKLKPYTPPDVTSTDVPETLGPTNRLYTNRNLPAPRPNFADRHIPMAVQPTSLCWSWVVTPIGCSVGDQPSEVGCQSRWTTPSRRASKRVLQTSLLGDFSEPGT
jgi:hypothetical protein